MLSNNSQPSNQLLIRTRWLRVIYKNHRKDWIISDFWAPNSFGNFINVRFLQRANFDKKKKRNEEKIDIIFFFRK